MHAIVIAIFAPAPIHFGFVLSIATMHNGSNIKKANNGFISSCSLTRSLCLSWLLVQWLALVFTSFSEYLFSTLSAALNFNYFIQHSSLFSSRFVLNCWYIDFSCFSSCVYFNHKISITIDLEHSNWLRILKTISGCQKATTTAKTNAFSVAQLSKYSIN